MVVVNYIDQASKLSSILESFKKYSIPSPDNAIPYELSHSIGTEKTSEKSLDKILTDAPIALDQFKLEAQLTKKDRRRLVEAIGEIYPKHSVSIGGEFVYTDGCFMGWHTNSNTPCKRVYLTYRPESNKSYFRYKHNNKIQTSYDREGWTLREFDIYEDDPLWHCVMSKTNRLSIGFRVVRNLKS